MQGHEQINSVDLARTSGEHKVCALAICRHINMLPIQAPFSPVPKAQTGWEICQVPCSVFLACKDGALPGTCTSQCILRTIHQPPSPSPQSSDVLPAPHPIPSFPHSRRAPQPANEPTCPRPLSKPRLGRLVGVVSWLARGRKMYPTQYII